MSSAKPIAPALSDFDIKLTGLLNMKIKLIALAIMASATSDMAYAQLSVSDLAVIEAYHQAHPEIPADNINAMKENWRRDLQDVRNYMAGATYNQNGVNIPLPPLDLSTPVTPATTKPQPVLSQPQNEIDATAHQQNPIDYRRDVNTAIEVTAQRQQRESDKNSALIAANQTRTLEQTEALNNSHLQRFAQLKGEALVKANQARTAEQTEALNDSYRQRFAQLKGEALVKANQSRTAEQTEALNDSYRQRFTQLKSEALVKANRARNAQQVMALSVAKSQPKAGATSIGYAYSNDGSNIVIGIKGQDEGDKVYDLDAMEDALSAHQSTLNKNSANIAANTSDITKSKSIINGVQSDVQKALTTGVYAQSRADAAYANTETNRQALQATNHRVADNSAAIANHEQRIEKLEANNNANFGKLKNEVDDNRQRASAAISGVAAMANIPQVIQGQTFSVGAGVGTTDGENALAVGFSARAAEHVVVKASVSDDTQQNFVVGGGVSYGW